MCYGYTLASIPIITEQERYLYISQDTWGCLESGLSRETECDNLNGWIKKTKKTKTVTYAKILPEMVNPRDIAGEPRRRRRRLWAAILPQTYCKSVDPAYCTRSSERLSGQTTNHPHPSLGFRYQSSQGNILRIAAFIAETGSSIQRTRRYSVLLSACLTCISETDLPRQLYVLPH